MSDDNKNIETQFRSLVIDELKIISENQRKTTEVLNHLNTEFKLHQKESQLRWEAIEKLDTEQNAILAEHRSTGLAQQEANKIARAELELKIQEIDGKVEKLEHPRIAIKMLVKVLVTVGSAAGALYAILKLLEIL